MNNPCLPVVYPGLKPGPSRAQPGRRHLARQGLVALTTLFLWAGCRPAEPAPSPSRVRVHGDRVVMATNAPELAALTIEPVDGLKPSVVPLTARLVWNEDVTVRVFTPFAGRVRKVLVEVGQTVQRGDPLALIDSPDYAQAQADAGKAESDLLLASRNLVRTRDLYDHGAAPRKDLDSAEADEARARSERERAFARLAIYGATNIVDTAAFLLPSPLAGTVVERNLTPGQEVRPDQMLANVPQFVAPLFVISDPTSLWLLLDVTEMAFPLIRRGSELRISSPALPGLEFKGHLEVLGDSLDPTTRTVRARASVPNPERLLKAELYVTAEIPDRVPMSLQVPSSAIFLRENKPYVFLEAAPGEFQRTAVRIGKESPGKVAVLEGLKQGQRLVTDGGLLLQSLIEQPPQP